MTKHVAMERLRGHVKKMGVECEKERERAGGTLDIQEKQKMLDVDRPDPPMDRGSTGEK